MGAYDPSRPQVIDPLVLSYSTFLGGGDGGESANDIAIDSGGDAYAVGCTGAPSYPTTSGAYDASLAGNTDAIVTKLNPTGTALIYSTLIGGERTDYANAVAVDSGGNAYVAGATDSTGPNVTNQFPIDRPHRHRRRFAGSRLRDRVLHSVLGEHLPDHARQSLQGRGRQQRGRVPLAPVGTPPPPADTTPPDTSITKAPPRKVKSKRLPVLVELAFGSSETGSTFACKVDGGPLQGCSSPATFKLGRGEHVIAVVATDAAGNADVSPATTEVEVKQKKRKQKGKGKPGGKR